MGQTFELESVERADRARTAGNEMAVLNGFAGELDDMRARIANFVEQDADDVLASISGIAGRLAGIRAQLYRLNSQRASSLRTREVDPLRDELELQFKVWSRRIALWEWELKMSGGGI